MKKLNILNRAYDCQDAAYDRIHDYLHEINQKFESEPEIIRDIELSIIEQLDAMLSERDDEVVSLIDVEFLIQKMGKVSQLDDIIDAKARITTHQNLYRDHENKIIGGVCAGIAAYFNITAWFVRFVFLICLFTPMPIVIIYLLMWYLLPPAKTKSEQLNMRGFPVNIKHIVHSKHYTRNKVINMAKLIAVLLAVLICVAVSISILVYIS